MAVISKGDFAAVVHHQGRCYAANRDTKTIYMFEQYADQWKQIYSFSINTKNGDFISLGILNNLLYVCSFNDNKIYAYTLSGDFQFTTGKYGKEAPGELSWSRIFDTNTSGTALISDYHNNRLQVLSASGQWSIVQLDPPVKSPLGACLVNDTLYVSHKNENGKRVISSYKS